MSPVIARALRRAALASAALTATLTAHALSTGGARVLPVAPMMWLSAVALAILPVAARREVTDFRAWSPVTLLGALLGGQAALHLLLHAAPWTLGLAVDHAGHGPLLTPRAAITHIVLALVFLAALCAGQDLLVRAVAIARAFVRAIRGPQRPRSLARPAGEAVPGVPLPASQWRRGPRSSRGPPPPAAPPAGPGSVIALV